MPLNATTLMNHEALWNAFERYLCAPYKNNQNYFASITQWYDELRERQQANEDLRLAYVEVNNEITGKKFLAFSLNRQMFFSHNSAVLALPYPRSELDSEDAVPSDRLIGIYLRDFGCDEHFLQCMEAKAKQESIAAKYPIENLGFEFSNGCEDYVNSIYSKIKKILKRKDFPGGMANDIGYWELRLAMHSPEASPWHLDSRLGPNSWARVIVHSLMRTGTLFALNEIFVTKDGSPSGPEVLCPTGTTSSHLAIKAPLYKDAFQGALHRAFGHPDGRAILIKPDESIEHWEPITPIPTPWTVTRLSPIFF